MYTLVYIKCYTKHRPSLSHCDGDNVNYALVMEGGDPSAVKINFGLKLNVITHTSVMCHYAAVLSQFGNLEMSHGTDATWSKYVQERKL
jgi:hypothetical protein